MDKLHVSLLSSLLLIVGIIAGFFLGTFFGNSMFNVENSDISEQEISEPQLIEEIEELPVNTNDEVPINQQYNKETDKQEEKIEAKSEDLTEVEVFNFRGETFSVRKRSSSVSQTIRKKGNGVGVQFYYTPEKNGEYGLHADIYNQKEDVLIPFSTSTQSFQEYSEGYASFQNYNILAKGRYKLLDEWLIGSSVEVHHRSSWSKNPARDLLLWEWKVNSLRLGIGSSYYLNKNLLVSVEYEYENVKSDSSKYIDSRSTAILSNNHLVKAGAEDEILPNTFLRAGFNFGIVEKDILSGGEDVSYYAVTCGVGVRFFNSFDVDLSFIYNNYKPKMGDKQRSQFGSFLTTKLYSF